MPLSVVEMEVEHLNKRDLHRIRETKLCYPLTEVFCNPVKNILALFLSEILFRVVKETEPDSRLFEYLFESIQLLELSDKGWRIFIWSFYCDSCIIWGYIRTSNHMWQVLASICWMACLSIVYRCIAIIWTGRRVWFLPGCWRSASRICRCILFPGRIVWVS